MTIAFYRCAACGSPNVKKDKKTGGYSYKKGLFGTLLFGAGGAAAGVNGKTEDVFICPDCGVSLSYCMSAEMKTKIESALSDPLFNRIEWEVLKKTFKNIEPGIIDMIQESQEAEVETASKQINRISESEFISLAKEVSSYIAKYGYFESYGKGKVYTATSLPDITTYTAFQNASIELIKHTPQFMHLVDIPTYKNKERNPIDYQWKSILSKMILKTLMLFNMSMEYYKIHHEWMPVNDEVAEKYFTTNKHLLPLAKALEVIEDQEKRLKDFQLTFPHLRPNIDLNKISFGFPDALLDWSMALKTDKYNFYLVSTKDIYTSDARIIPTITINDGILEVNHTVEDY